MGGGESEETREKPIKTLPRWGQDRNSNPGYNDGVGNRERSRPCAILASPSPSSPPSPPLLPSLSPPPPQQKKIPNHFHRKHIKRMIFFYQTQEELSAMKEKYEQERKDEVVENVATVLLEYDGTGSDKDLISALDQKYDALKDKLLLEAIKKQLGKGVVV